MLIPIGFIYTLLLANLVNGQINFGKDSDTTTAPTINNSNNEKSETGFNIRRNPINGDAKDGNKLLANLLSKRVFN